MSKSNLPCRLFLFRSEGTCFDSQAWGMQPGVPFWALPSSRAGCWHSEAAEEVEEANGQATGLGHGTGRWAPRGRASGGGGRT